MAIVATKDVVQALFDYRKPLDKKFSEITVNGKPVYLYPDPFKVKISDLTSTDKRIIVRDGDVACRLTAEEEFALLGMLSEEMGFPVRHPYFVEQWEAAYSDAGAEFKRNVQTPYWSRTGQLIIVKNDAYIRRMLGVQAPDGATGQLIVPDKALSNGYRITAIAVPTKPGYFNSLSGPIPADNDIMPNRPDEGRVGRWGDSYPDDKGVSAVWCYWLSVDGGLGAYAISPLDWYGGGVLGMATDAPLNK